MGKKITLDDIARKTGYSKATVSRALSGSGAIGSRARIIIAQEAARSGYFIHTRNVAVLMPYYFFGDYFGVLATALAQALVRNNFVPIILNSRDFEILNEISVCGAVSLIPKNEHAIKWGLKHNLPLVCVNTKSIHFDGIYMVASNEFQGSRILLERLAAAGHKKILRISEPTAEDDTIWGFSGRQKAFQELSSEFGLNGKFFACGRDMESIFSVLQKAMPFKPTAILLESEAYYEPTVTLLQNLGFRVPKDISIAAWVFPDQKYYNLPQPVSISQNFNRLAEYSVQMLERILDGLRPKKDILVDYDFHPGETIAAPSDSSFPLLKHGKRA